MSGNLFHWSDERWTLEDGTEVFVCTDYRKNYTGLGEPLIVGCTQPGRRWSDVCYSGSGVRYGVWKASDGLPYGREYPLRSPLHKGPLIIEDWRL